MTVKLKNVNKLPSAGEYLIPADDLPMGIAVYRRNEFLYANRIFAELHGYPSIDEILATSPDKLIADSERGNIAGMRKKLLSGGKSAGGFETRVQRPDGSTVWLEFVERVVDWEGGPAIQATVTDISSRWETEERLREKESLLELIIENIPVGLSVVDKELTATVANLNFYEMMDLPTHMRNGGRNFEDFIRFNAERGEYGEVDLEPFVADRVKQAKQFIAHQFVRQRPNGEFLDIRGNPTPGGGFITTYMDVTDQKLTEEELRAEKERYKNLIEGSIQGILIHRDFKLIFSNQALAEMFGYESQEEMQSVGTLLNILAPYEHDRIRKLYGDRMKGRKVLSRFEFDGLRKDGSIVSVELKAKVVIWEGEKAVQATFSDISEQKQIEKELRAHERLLQTVFDSLPQWVFVKDLDSRMVLVNEAFARDHGKAKEEFTGVTTRTLAQGDSQRLEDMLATDRKVFQSGEALHLPEHTAYLPDGKLHFRQTVKVPLRDETGAVVGLVAVSEDVTSRKQADEALRANQRLLQTVFDTIPVGISVKDREGRYLMVNPELSKLFGKPQKDFINFRPDEMEMFAIEEMVHATEQDRKVLEKGVMVQVPEDILTRPDGETIWCHVIKTPLLGENGEIIGLVGVREDITEKKRTEQAIQQTQKLESLGVMAGGIAHDFNNILLSILGSAGLALLHLAPGHPATQEIRQIETAGQRAAGLCRQMLDYSGRGPIAREEFDLRRLVEELTPLLGVSIPKNVEIKYRFVDPLPLVTGDPSQIQQVVMNLLINGSEAIGEHGGEIVILLEPVAADQIDHSPRFVVNEISQEAGELVRFKVTDTGSGMSAETLERLFEPFFTTKFTGRGLGLAAVLGIVKGHGGALAVESELGKGTTFEMLLPGHTRPADEALPGKAEAGEYETGDSEAGRDEPSIPAEGTILLVDDEEDIRSVTGKMLEVFGFTVITVDNGVEAVEMFEQRSNEIDAVLLDLTMPRMGGEETLKNLRAISRDIPVIMMSGFHEREISGRFAGQGIDGFLQKPFSADVLEHKFRVLLEEREPANSG